MKKNNLIFFSAILFNLSILSLDLVIGQTQNTSQFEYLNPLPNSQYVSVKSSIIIRKGIAIDKNTVGSNLINVYGSKSGQRSGKIILSGDSRTLIFEPDFPFATDESVSVRLDEGLKTIDGMDIGNLFFQFHTSKNINTFEFNNGIDETDSSITTSGEVKEESLSSILADLPTLIVNKNDNSAPGYLFLGPRPYLMIVDNEGAPVFYRNVNGPIFDFKVQPNGELTYFVYPDSCYGIDSSYNIVRRYHTSNGYTINVHELRVLPNGSYYIFGTRNVTIDMSKIVEGGQTDAEVLVDALQEFDSTGSLVFQWDGLDHYDITDVDEHVDLTQSTIDFTHFNAVDFDTDSNLLVSARNLEEITKIDHKTGNIIWRLGGKNNQFQFVNDDLGFSRQHYIRRLSNGNIGIFDNGTYHPVNFSSFVEYQLDETNKVATLVNRYTHNEEVYTPTEGSVQELPNGNKFISWGHIYNPAVTEIHPDNTIAYELSYSSFQNKYRAYRFEWETNLFMTNVDSLDFGSVADADSALRYLTIYNPKENELTINQFFCKEPSFKTLNSLPLAIPAKDSAVITIKFQPKFRGVFEDKLNIRIVSIEQLIARQVMLKGSTIELINPIKKPTGLTASLVSSGSILLNWDDNSSNELGFIIQRALGEKDTATTFTNIDTVGADTTTYTDTTVSDTTTYTYRVYGYNLELVSDFSNTAEITTPIPVELTSFIANVVNGTVLLKWETATETNNAGFSLERSSNNLSFKQIAFIEGQGTTTDISVYSYTDKSTLSGKYFYRLKQIDLDGSFHYSKSIEANLGIPKEFALDQNYPNPFNPSTKIEFAIPKTSFVTLKIFDGLGGEVATLINEEKSPGKYNIEFNAEKLASGIYFYRLIAGAFVQNRKMILLK